MYVHLAIRVVPNLGPGSGVVDGRIGGIVELLRRESMRGLGQNLLGLGYGALHAIGARGQHDFGAEREQQHAALQAHGFRHGEDQPVALHGGYKSQGNAGIAAGGLNQHRFAGLDFAGLLCGLNQRQADAVLHA
jgi:hypothetical protein